MFEIPSDATGHELDYFRAVAQIASEAAKGADPSALLRKNLSFSSVAKAARHARRYISSKDCKYPRVRNAISDLLDENVDRLARAPNVTLRGTIDSLRTDKQELEHDLRTAQTVIAVLSRALDEQAMELEEAKDPVARAIAKDKNLAWMSGPAPGVGRSAL